MRLLSRYIGLHILGATLVVTLMFLGVEVFIHFLSESRFLGTGDYNLLRIMMYVFMTLPQELYSLFPMIALVGALIGLGVLAQHSELIVMRASGMTLQQVVLAVVKVTIALVLMITLVGEVFAPQLTRVAEQHRDRAMGNGDSLQTLQGTWVKSGRSFIHIGSVLGQSELANITRYEFNSNSTLAAASFSKRAEYQDGSWYLYDTKRSIFAKDSVSVKSIPKQKLDIALRPSLLKVALDQPEEMRLPRLYSFIRFQHASGLNADNYSLAFWKRLFQPLATAVMIFLAVPFIFGPLRTVSMGLRVVSGVVMGFSFYILNEFFGPFSLVFRMPPFLAAIIPTLLFAALAVYLLRRVR